MKKTVFALFVVILLSSLLSACDTPKTEVLKNPAPDHERARMFLTERPMQVCEKTDHFSQDSFIKQSSFKHNKLNEDTYGVEYTVWIKEVKINDRIVVVDYTNDPKLTEVFQSVELEHIYELDPEKYIDRANEILTAKVVKTTISYTLKWQEIEDLDDVEYDIRMMIREYYKGENGNYWGWLPQGDENCSSTIIYNGE
ncbi:MAG TPA: hypothetical protein VLH94_03340 [Spirochaetia bacterium]|nr:hypothetical protein [Spirochaetia bacterium]